MGELVFLKRDDCFTNSLLIAEGTGVGHEKIKRAIKKYKRQLEKYGKLSVPYQLESTGGRPTEIYLLSEPQATFLITLLKNTETVVEFKMRLVDEFYKMRAFILERQSAHWLETRRQGKLTRKAETDTIKELVEYARMQGSKNADKLYMIYSKLANKMAGVESREEASVMQLNNLSLIEIIILQVIKQGMAEGKHYKEIYQDCKVKLETFRHIACLETV